jgi:hypothetical protein
MIFDARSAYRSEHTMNPLWRMDCVLVSDFVRTRPLFAFRFSHDEGDVSVDLDLHQPPVTKGNVVAQSDLRERLLTKMP